MPTTCGTLRGLPPTSTFTSVLKGGSLEDPVEGDQPSDVSLLLLLLLFSPLLFLVFLSSLLSKVREELEDKIEIDGGIS